MEITFLGAADGVTGSRHLVRSDGARVLLDCGLFQGFKLQRERNWFFPPELHELDAVVLSHAHLDHSGWLPLLVKRGFGGPILAHPATIDLATLLLMDSAHLQEEDARRANRGGWSRHVKALPLYTKADARRAIERFKPLLPGRSVRIGPGGRMQVSLAPVGHLPGACSVLLDDGHARLLYSGDVGREHDLMLPPPKPPREADVLLIESTYGNREHPHDDAPARLATIITETIARGGSVLLPSFAVGRAQALLLVLQRLKAAGAIPKRLPIALDSPMAQQATAVWRRHARLMRVPVRETEHLTDGVQIVETAVASMRLSATLASKGMGAFPRIVISASGMATGGRVLHHLKVMAPDPRHAIVFPGFQVGGSRGARLVAGEREVKIHGEMVPVRATVHHLEGLSGHADREELLRWAGAMPRVPAAAFVVHGEPDAADALRFALQQRLNWPRVAVAAHGQSVSI